MTDRELIQKWMRPGAMVPVDMNTVRILLDALRERLAQPEQEPVPWQTEETYDKDGVLIGRRMKRGPDCEWEPWLIPQRRERLAQPQRTHWEGCEEVHPECKKQETVMAEYKFQTYAAYKTDGEMKIGVVPEQEPVAWLYRDYYNTLKLAQTEPPPPLAFPVYTAPPRREWVGLTDEEKLHLEIMGGKSDVMLAEAIEAKLKEKNA